MAMDVNQDRWGIRSNLTMYHPNRWSEIYTRRAASQIEEETLK
jgi:hypothetical protein